MAHRPSGLLLGALLFSSSQATAAEPAIALVYRVAPAHLAESARIAEARLKVIPDARVSREDGKLVVLVHRPETVAEVKGLLEPAGVLSFARVAVGETTKNLAAYVEGDPHARTLGVSWDVELLEGRQKSARIDDIFLMGPGEQLKKYLTELPAPHGPAPKRAFVIGPHYRNPNAQRTYYLDLRDSFTVTRVEAASPTEQTFLPGHYVVDVRLTPADGRKLLKLSTALVDQWMAILVDRAAYSVPRVETPLPGGHFHLLTIDERAATASRLANILGSGALPAPLTLISEERR